EPPVGEVIETFGALLAGGCVPAGFTSIDAVASLLPPRVSVASAENEYLPAGRPDMIFLYGAGVTSAIFSQPRKNSTFATRSASAAVARSFNVAGALGGETSEVMARLTVGFTFAGGSAPKSWRVMRLLIA